MDFGETVAVEGPGSDALKRAASKCETSLLSNYPNASANHFVRGAHHRRCAREGLTGRYDALKMGPVASFSLIIKPQAVAKEYISLTKYISNRQYMSDMIHNLTSYDRSPI
jgi:hypothetical protein